MPKTRFTGFHPQLLHFLDDLSRNNDRAWFQANKSRYETELLEPALAFIEAMEKPLAKISPHFHAVAKRTGGSLMRIYRDTRFAKDKQPYKTNVGIHFRHERCKDVHAPGFYLHIEPEQAFLGCGIWKPDSASLKMIRDHIHKDPAEWKRTRDGKAFRGRFQLAGDTLKRPPRGFDADHPLIEDLRRKDYIAVCNVDLDSLFQPTLVREVATSIKTSGPFVKLLCDAIRLPF